MWRLSNDVEAGRTGREHWTRPHRTEPEGQGCKQHDADSKDRNEAAASAHQALSLADELDHDLMNVTEDEWNAEPGERSAEQEGPRGPQGFVKKRIFGDV
jgi:hypothetical protein